MKSKTQFRSSAFAVFSASALLSAQSVSVPAQRHDRQPVVRVSPAGSKVPATAPTSVPAQPVPSQPPTPVTPGSQPARKATISFSGGRLTVVAANSSLNQILRDISHAASIQVTGGVAEERVFGTYGPGTPLEVVTALLDGTGTNMLLIEGSGERKSELVLTARNGGPTPPDPNASSFDGGSTQAQEESAQQDPNTPNMPEPTTSGVTPESQGTAQPAATPTVATPGAQPATTSAQPAGDSTPSPATPQTAPDGASQSPNGTKTPQQIFEELMKRRQQPQ